MSYNLFLDDVRQPEQCVNYVFPLGIRPDTYVKYEWVVVKNYKEFVAYIEENGMPERISFDHDLGEEEIWCDIDNYENLYQVSNKGRVKSLPRKTTAGRILMPIKTESGLLVGLHNMDNIHVERIHRLVAKAFILNPEDKPQVNHINGNRWDNDVNNLEWVTNAENTQHSHDNLEREYTAYGENHKNSKTVAQYTLDNELIAVYGSANEAGRQLNVCFSNIARCARGKGKTAAGYIWKYEDLPITHKAEIEHVKKSDKNYSSRFYIPDFDKTGYDCAKWLVDKCINERLRLPECFVHSMNPVGSQNIKNVLNDYGKFY